MGGEKFSWKIFDWQQSDRDRQLLTLKSQQVSQQRRCLLNTLERMDGKYMEDIATLEKPTELRRGNRPTAAENWIRYLHTGTGRSHLY